MRHRDVGFGEIGTIVQANAMDALKRADRAQQIARAVTGPIDEGLLERPATQATIGGLPEALKDKALQASWSTRQSLNLPC